MTYKLYRIWHRFAQCFKLECRSLYLLLSRPAAPTLHAVKPLCRSTCTMVLFEWIPNVTNASLIMPQSIFSFQNALDLGSDSLKFSTEVSTNNSSLIPYSTPKSDIPFLFGNGCLQEDNSQNCTASCQEVTAVFGSLDTLHNCMVYPTIADQYSRNNLSNASIAKSYNIQQSKNGSDLYTNITKTITNCLADYCAITLKGSGCNESRPTTDIFSIDGYYQTSADFDLCSYVPKSFNPDIGGIGVR